MCALMNWSKHSSKARCNSVTVASHAERSGLRQITIGLYGFVMRPDAW